jgi:hypothetical protein
MNMTNDIDLGLNVELQGVEDRDKLPQLFAYAYDANGSFIGKQGIERANARLVLPKRFSGKSIRILIAPETEATAFSELKRMGAYETRFSLRDNLGLVNISLPPDHWRPLLRCVCHITGQVIKRVSLPDGTIKNLPICHARVTICEIDRLPVLIQKLPDHLLWKLRDYVITAPPVPPQPPELPIDPVGPIIHPTINLPVSGNASLERVNLSAKSSIHECESCKKSVTTQLVNRANVSAAQDEELVALRPLMLANSVEILRTRFIELIPKWIYRLCWIDWLEPFFKYHKHCFRTVMTDDSGRFSALMFYPCNDKPDLYFSVDQWQGSAWESIYKPSIRCGTHWNYQCGSEIILVVTDPAAIPCSPQDPVTPPDDIGTWIMPYMVGGMPVFGNPSAGSALNGWVKPNGYVDYTAGGLGLLANSPFGGTLGFRLGYSSSVPSAAVKYYRFSYRKTGALAWSEMSMPVGRHYVHEVPGQLPTFPVYQLGPNTIGSQGNVFEFKPDSPPAPLATDPAGTITYWPEDDWFGDIYSAFLNTTSLPGNPEGAAGQYEIKIEIFNASGVQVPVGAAFNFIVPETITSGGVTARVAEVQEIANNAFIFKLQIDNNLPTASIDAPAISASNVTDACGFLRYQSTLDPVSLAFHAQHPNNQAVFRMGLIRGTEVIEAASVAGYPQVGTSPVAVQDGLAAHAYIGDSAGNYAQTYSASVLLEGCENAAYAISLGVYGKATNGWGRIGYDDSDLRAFALAESS